MKEGTKAHGLRSSEAQAGKGKKEKRALKVRGSVSVQDPSLTEARVGQGKRFQEKHLEPKISSVWGLTSQSFQITNKCIEYLFSDYAEIPTH